MNIATELLAHIRARSIDSYYAIEEALMEGRSLSRDDKATLPTLITEGGTAEDRLRLFLVMHLHPGLVPPAEVQQHEEALREAGVDMRPYTFLQRQSALASTAAAQRPAEPASAGGRVFSNVMRLADKAGVGGVVNRGVSALAAGVRQLLPSVRQTPVTQLVSALMDNKGGAEEEAYAYLDPKLGRGADGASAASRSRNPYNQAIAFVVGPGNYLEYQSLRQCAQTAQPTPGVSGTGRKVTYGCTEVLTPTEFVTQIGALGAA